jgi:hypothetical protein
MGPLVGCFQPLNLCDVARNFGGGFELQHIVRWTQQKYCFIERAAKQLYAISRFNWPRRSSQFGAGDCQPDSVKFANLCMAT